jgi:hypothetical protein
MEGNDGVDINVSLPAVTTSHNAPGPIGSMDNSSLDATWKVFRRIHFFRLSENSEVRTLKQVMAMTCSVAQSQLGDIYLFYDPRFPNIIRMGCTTLSPERRLAQWRSRCSPILQGIPDALRRPVHHPNRFEQLLHRDLGRRRKWCQDCNHVHMECFEVTETLALATVQLWRRWMEMEPYDEVGELKRHWKQQIQGPNSPATREELYTMLKDGDLLFDDCH